MKSRTHKARSLYLAVAIFVGAATSTSAASVVSGVDARRTRLLHNNHARGIKHQQQDVRPLVEGDATALLSTDAAALSVSGGQEVEKVTNVVGHTWVARRACARKT